MLARRGLSKRVQFRRGLATSASHDPAKIRNMALVAHIDSGKTTLTESILLTSSYLSSSGSVDTGSTTTDFLPAERERGITIQSASIPVRWKDWLFNLVDTPGHADFGMEVESASRVVDGAVVLIDSVEGVEAQTKGVWKQLDRYDVRTRIMFLNKLDRPGASFSASLSSLLSHRLHPHPMALTLPIASFDPQDYARAEPGIHGLVDLVNWEVWKWDAEGQSTRHSLPTNPADLAGLDFIPSAHPILPHLAPARTQLLDNLSMFSEDLMEALLSLPPGPQGYLGFNNKVLMSHLRQAALQNEILPVLCGSAMKNIGTDLVMDYVGALLPSPLDIEHEPGKENAPLRLLAWKVTWDKRLGWMTFVRVYSGKVNRKTTLMNNTRGQKERISKLLLLYASQTEEVEELSFGSVGVLLGLKYTRTGDTLGSSGAPAASRTSLREITTPPAVMAVAVIPNSHAELQPVQDALEALSRTDPSVRVDTQEGQILAHGLGALHLEIVEGRLRDEWGVNFEFGTRRVSFRESLGPGTPSPSASTWKTDVGGTSTTVSIHLELRALAADEPGDPAWDGNVVVDKTGAPFDPPTSFSGTHNAFVAHGLASALSNSPHTSLAMSQVHIRVHGFEMSRDVHPSTLTGAAAVILRNSVREAGMGPVLEPFVSLKVSVNEDSLGKAVKDLTEHGAEVLDLGTGSMVGADGTEELGGHPEEGNYIPPLWLSPSGDPTRENAAASTPRLKRTINAIAPLSQMLDFSSRLRALSGGHGVFEMANAGFKQVSNARRLEILKEIGRA
ncbi:P-loop containing nucleoside triphosphate hydrolase protein [Mycena alexandri]|uniref:P-loop containing nucleoside triphosphate hydrolase protein n=1 Tax=Mycena alexandri TaxID=1745969 RepID=A0AAD6XEP4_9AGAR|nr:P-loop containing nucleoside triphosphate hydrolase protein [Mycena alexandri]